MRPITIALLLILSITFAEAATEKGSKGRAASAAEAVKEKIHDAKEAVKDKLNLNVDEKGVPKQAGETAEDVKEGIDHAKKAADAASSIPTDGIKDKIHDAVDAVKETLKLTKSGAETVKDAQGIPPEGVKDATKEGIHAARVKGGVGAKVEDVKEFVKDEVIETKDAVTEGLGIKDPKGTVETVVETAKKTVEHVQEVIKEKLHKDDGAKEQAKEEPKEAEQPKEPEQPQGTVNKVIDSAKKTVEHAQEVIKEKLNIGGEKAQETQETQQAQPSEPAPEPTLVDQIKEHIYRVADTIKQTVGYNSSGNTAQGNDDEEL